MTRVLLRRTTTLVRRLCSEAKPYTGELSPPVTRRTRSLRAASDRALYVNYMDTATVRRRLVHVAQQVRTRLEDDGMEQPPQIDLPRGERVLDRSTI